MGEQLSFMGRSAVYVLEAFVLMWIAKFAYTRIYRRVSLKDEIFGRSNSALAVSTAGYLLGIVIALGGVLTGPSAGLQADLTSIALFGLQTVVMMLVASFICEKLLLHHFDNTKEVVEDQNLGTAFVEAGLHIANGLILLSIQQGGGCLADRNRLLGNRPDRSAAGGIAVRVDHLAQHSRRARARQRRRRPCFRRRSGRHGKHRQHLGRGDFTGWAESLKLFAADVLFGLVALYLIKKLTDLLLAPGVSLAREQTAETPRIGAGLLEAFGYVGGSMLIVWVF